MSEIGEDFRAFKEEGQARRAKNRQSSAAILRAHGHGVLERTASHLIVETHRGKVDFYPGTGLWRVRGTSETGRGVFGLVAWAQGTGRLRA